MLGFIRTERGRGQVQADRLRLRATSAWVYSVYVYFSRHHDGALFSSVRPGGIFAPMLALGTLLSTAFGMPLRSVFRHTIWMRVPLPLPG